MSHYILILQEKPGPRYSKTIKTKAFFMDPAFKALKKGSVPANTGR
jgi:hypothetical protein